MPMPQYNGPMYSQGPTAVGPYNLPGYQSTFGYNPQQTYLPQTQQPQMADCCCSIQRAIDGVNYNNAQNFCNLGNTMQSVGRDIIENQNANYRQLHDELGAYSMEEKDNTIAELRSQVNALNLAASQSNQNTYLIDRLQPCPTPAYVVPNPNGYYGCQQNGYQSCGC